MARKIIIYAVFAVIVANLVIITLVFIGGASPAPRPMPNPNGYDDFVKAGQMVTGRASDYAKMSKDQLELLMATNAEALSFLNAGLDRECRERLGEGTNPSNGPVTGLGNFRDLACLLCAQARLAELDGRLDEASTNYLRAIRFTQEFTRGGIIISRLIGIVNERVASRQLLLLLQSLNAGECHQIANQLEMIDGKEESIEDTMLNEKEYGRKVYGIRGKIEALIEYRKIREINDDVIAGIRANTLRRRHLMLSFAARAYELEKGKAPQSTADLVPDYLKTIPKDPTTGKELGLGP
jgi:hypothetical protein